MFILESPHRGNSNEYTQYTIFQYEKEKCPKLSQICSYGILSKGLKNEFERATVNGPSVFEPLKFYYKWLYLRNQVHLIYDKQNFAFRHVGTRLEHTAVTGLIGVLLKSQQPWWHTLFHIC